MITTQEAYEYADVAEKVYAFSDTDVFTIKEGKQYKYDNPESGLQLAIYEGNGINIIAIRGTEPKFDAIANDWLTTDLGMYISTWINTLPDVFMEALAQVKSLGLGGNTIVVGHSMGGSIAQYIGGALNLETYTYNAYGIGDMYWAPVGSHDNITNFVTLGDPVSKLPGSEMIGQTYMLQDETLDITFGHGKENFTNLTYWERGYSPVDDIQRVEDINGIGSSGLDSDYELALMLSEGREFAMINGTMDDVIYGGEKYNLLIGGSGKDTLYGMGGSDNLQGGKDDDRLVGGYDDKDDGVFDALYGGEGFDTYIAGNSDIIMDEDGSGEVYFDETLLTGGKKEAGSGCEPTEEDGSSVYKGNGGTYTLSGDTLTFEKGGETLTILNLNDKRMVA